MPGNSDILVRAEGKLLFNGKEYRCALGKGGVRTDKREGDGATPQGCFAIREVLYRPDKFEKPPHTVLPTRPLSPDDGWSDDVALPEYNTLVKLPYSGSHEELWRQDDLYDLIVVLGYNDPPVAGKGSAIFMHVAREAYTPTAGCVALSKVDLLEILGAADAGIQVCIE
ncbi:L,D-transpeptidase family protein [Candidatus Kaiserbacteria bacterium]|nr:L,D-transpeptidase family protein [Candidatus Kaiserbacteria bacterium]